MRVRMLGSKSRGAGSVVLRWCVGVSLFALAAALPASSAARNNLRQTRRQAPSQTPQGPPQTAFQTRSSAGRQPVDGTSHNLPEETFAVVPGTRFLVALESNLSTKLTRENSRFRVRTLEPLEAGGGFYLPAGAEITAHVSRVEPAGVAGRARIFLTFDELRTHFGKLPIVADVVSVPGDHSVRAGGVREGGIEGRTSTQRSAAEAAAAGAAIGAVHGVREKDKKEAAEGAAMGAITAYLMESGRGHEINLPKGAKLELEIERVLYLIKD